VAAVQRPHHADASHHGWAVEFHDQEHGFDRGLPFRDLLFGRRQLLDIFSGILEGDELAAAGQGNGIVERSQLAAARDARRYFSAVQSR
jgi:hypothetical protein